MKFFSFSRLFGTSRRARTSRNAPRPHALRGKAPRLTLEALEDRLAPAVVTWTGADSIASGGLLNNWKDPNNWKDDTGHVRMPTNGDILVFGSYTPPTAAQVQAGAPNIGRTNNDFAGEPGDSGIPIFQEIIFQTPNWVVQGNPVHLTGNNGIGILSTNGPGDLDPATPDINLQLFIAQEANLTFQVQNTNALMFVSLGVRLNGHQLTLEADGNSILNVTGKLDDLQSFNRGNSSLVKTGTGMVTVAGDNLYAGPTTVAGGFLVVQSNTALGPVTALVTGGSRQTGTTVLPGASLYLGSNITGGGLFVREDLFLAGDGAQGLGTLINLGSDPALGQTPVSNTLVGTINLESPFGETLVNTLSGGTLHILGGIKQQFGSQATTQPVQALTKTGGGTLFYDGRGPDPLWFSTTTPFENLFFTNTYTGTTVVKDGTLVLNKEVRENDQGNPPVRLLIGSGVTAINPDGSYVGGHNLPTDPRLGTTGPTGGYAIQGNLVIGDGAGGRDSAQVVTLVAEPSRDDPAKSPPTLPNEAEDEQIADRAAVTVNSDGLFNVNTYGDPYRVHDNGQGIFVFRPMGDRIALLSVVGGDVVLGVNRNPMFFPPPVLNGNPVAPPAFIVGHLLVGNLTMQGGTITGQVMTDTSDEPGVTEQLQGTLMLLNNAGITTLASNTPAVINCLLNMGFQTRTDVTIDGPAGIDLDIQGPMGNGGLTVSASTGLVRLLADSRNLPDNITFPPAFIEIPPPQPPLSGVVLQSGTLLLANNNALGSGRLVIFGGQLQSDSARTLNNAVTIGGDFSVVGDQNLTLSGPIVLNGTHTVSVGGLVTTFSGTVTNVQGGSGGLYKAGPGTLVYAGTNANTYTGTTWVRDGVLLLDKSANVTAVPGPLYVGDGAGAANSAVLGVLASEQIADAKSVVVSTDGLLQLIHGATETVGGLQTSGGVLLGDQNGSARLNVNGPLVMAGGAITSGHAGSAVQLGGDVTAYPGGGTASITADVVLAGANPHTFTVNGGTSLAVGGAISGAGQALYKAGAGTLVFYGSTDNTYSGTTWVQDGGLLLAKSGALAVAGALYIGDGVGASNSAVVGVATNEQIANTSSVFINTEGMLEIGTGVTESIDSLAVYGTLLIDSGGLLRVHKGGLAGNLVFAPGATFVDNSGNPKGGLQPF
jgi:fibronectin-binding autotransporter adhesin